MPSATVSSSPSSARPRMRRTSGRPVEVDHVHVVSPVFGVGFACTRFLFLDINMPSHVDRGRSVRATDLPASPELQVVTHEAVGTDVVGPRAGAAPIQELRTRSVLGIDGEALAQDRGRRASVTRRSSRSSGHGRSGLMWSGVSGEMPPQSLRPAAGSAAVARVGKIRRGLDVHLRPEEQARHREGAQRGPAGSGPAPRASGWWAWPGSSG